MLRTSTLAIACVISWVIFALPSSGGDAPVATLRGHWDDGRTVEYRVVPDARLIFPNGDAAVTTADKPSKWQNPANPFAKKVDFVTVSDMQKRFSVAGVVFGDEMFIFDEFLCGQNGETMTRLMLATGTAPKNSGEALRLASVFLSLSNYSFEDPARFIASRRDDLPKEADHRPGLKIADLLGIWHAPQASESPFGYEVDLFTMYPDLNVEHWRLTIGSRGVTELLNRSDSATYKTFAQPTGPTKITFQLGGVVANGFTEDGGMTDIRGWVASDGPGIGRVHYYFKLRENADKLVQQLLNSAIATIDSGAWLDSDGNVAGKQWTIVLPTPDKTHLMADDVFREDADPNVLVISCPCLRNLLASRN